MALPALVKSKAAGMGSVARFAAYSVWMLCLTLLAVNLGQYLAYAFQAVIYPYGIDYGEGIVWQQALLMFGPDAYGEILQSPYLVFHYPPVYHLVVRAVAGMGVDILAAGRGISIASVCMAALLAGWLAMQGSGNAWGHRALAGVVACLTPFTLEPVVFWSSVMRVDLLALSLSLGGVACATASLRKPAALYISVVLFVLAAFTKQTALAAPMAALGMALVRTPRHGIAAILFGAMLGGTAMAGLQAATGGGFLRHVITYNLNRFDAGVAALAILGWLSHCAVYAVLATMAVLSSWRLLRPGWRGPAGFLVLVRRDDRAAWFALMTTYFAASTATLLTAGKSGASSNYFLEWGFIVCIWLGVLAAEIHESSGRTRRRIISIVMVPLALIMQCNIQPSLGPQLTNALIGTDQRRDSTNLLEAISYISGPVLSDDMVLLLRSGKQVILEPAIFAELAATGRWPESTLISLLDQHAFGAVVTEDSPGNALFESRYLPASRAAIARNYGMVTSIGTFQIRMPEEQH